MLTYAYPFADNAEMKDVACQKWGHSQTSVNQHHNILTFSRCQLISEERTVEHTGLAKQKFPPKSSATSDAEPCYNQHCVPLPHAYVCSALTLTYIFSCYVKLCYYQKIVIAVFVTKKCDYSFVWWDYSQHVRFDFSANATHKHIL
jgi:hypothetical protein